MKKALIWICMAAVCLILLPQLFVYATTIYYAEDLVCTMNGFPAQGEFYYGDFEVTLALDTKEKQNNPPCVVAVQYNNLGTVVNCGVSTLSEDGASVKAEMVIREVKNTNIKIYVWNSLQSMTPIMQECVSLESGNGTLAGQKVYYNETFNDTDLSVDTVLKNGNTLTVENGYAKIVKYSADSCYFNMSFNNTSKHIIIEADFRNGTATEEELRHGILFFVREFGNHRK